MPALINRTASKNPIRTVYSNPTVPISNGFPDEDPTPAKALPIRKNGFPKLSSDSADTKAETDAHTCNNNCVIIMKNGLSPLACETSSTSTALTPILTRAESIGTLSEASGSLFGDKNISPSSDRLEPPSADISRASSPKLELFDSADLGKLQLFLTERTIPSANSIGRKQLSLNGRLCRVLRRLKLLQLRGVLRFADVQAGEVLEKLANGELDVNRRGSAGSSLEVTDVELSETADKLIHTLNRCLSEADPDLTDDSDSDSEVESLPLTAERHKKIPSQHPLKAVCARNHALRAKSWLRIQISRLKESIRCYDTGHHSNEQRPITFIAGEQAISPTVNDNVLGEGKVIPAVQGDSETERTKPHVILEPYSDHQYVAARTRPLREHRKRRLINTSILFDTEFSPRPCHCVKTLEQSCVLCAPESTTTPEESSFADQLSHLDPSFHPILSQPSEASTTLLNYGSRADCPTEPPVPTEKEKPVVLATPIVRWKKPAIQRKPQPQSTSDIIRLKKKKRKVERRRSSVTPSLSSTSSVVPSSATRHKRNYSSTTTTNDDETSSQATSDSWTSSSANVLKKAFRKAQQDPYDIDNIVIPACFSSNAKVEVLPVKEIITPGWREVSLQPDSSPVRNDVFLSDSAAKYDEPLSDNSYLTRHGPCELLERQKFARPVVPVPKRSRRSSFASSHQPSHQPETTPIVVDKLKFAYEYPASYWTRRTFAN